MKIEVGSFAWCDSWVDKFVECNGSVVNAYITKIERQIAKKFDECCLLKNQNLASEFGEHVLFRMIQEKLCEDKKWNTKRVKSKKIKDLSMSYDYVEDDKKLDWMMNRFWTLIDIDEYECIEHLLIDDDSVPAYWDLQYKCPYDCWCSTCTH